MSNPQRVVSLTVLAALSWGLVSFFEPRDDEASPAMDAPLLGALYAAPVERVETHVLNRGETLSGVLARASISGGQLANLLLALREHKSPRELRDGIEVTVRRWVRDDSPRAVDVRLNADSTVRLLSGMDGWTSDVVVTPTSIDTVFVAGRIAEGKSLYHTLVEDESLGLQPAERYALVAELAEIYSYRLDFSHDIQPGDTYRFVYEREVRPDGSARRRRILAAEMENNGRLFPALWFDPESDRVGGYYDREGRSLRTAFRRYPVEYVRITSSFNWNRYHPVLGIYRAHLGTDFGAPQGTRVVATGDGVVAFAGRKGGYGNLVEIRHPGGYVTRYAHLSRFASGVRSGRGVAQGAVIGYVGATGLATAPHLHYELRKDGRPLDARRAKLPGAPPIPAALRGEFEALVPERIALLDRVPFPGPRLAGTGATSREAASEQI